MRSDTIILARTFLIDENWPADHQQWYKDHGHAELGARVIDWLRDGGAVIVRYRSRTVPSFMEGYTRYIIEALLEPYIEPPSEQTLDSPTPGVLQ